VSEIFSLQLMKGGGIPIRATLGGGMVREMLRRLFTVGSAVSLVLCLATCLLWVRSLNYADDVVKGCWEFSTGNGTIEIDQTLSDSGSLLSSTTMAYRSDRLQNLRGGSGSIRERWPGLPGFSLGQLSVPAFGLSTDPNEVFPDITTRYIVLPLWSVVALFGLFPAVYFSRRRRRGENTGMCDFCGYDLRATPDRCPECGLTQ
jgi:hypothetical protein